MLRFAVPALLVACASCPPIVERPDLAACLVGDELPEERRGVRRVAFQADATTDDVPRDGCGTWVVGDGDAARNDDAALWVRMRPEDSDSVWVGIWADDFDLPDPADRRPWTLDVRVDGGGASYLHLQEEFGTTVFWIGEASDLDELQRPLELIVHDGRPVCRLPKDCGAVQDRTLEVEVDGARQELRPHERMEADTSSIFRSRTHTVVHGGYASAKQDACESERFVRVAWWER